MIDPTLWDAFLIPAGFHKIDNLVIELRETVNHFQKLSGNVEGNYLFYFFGFFFQITRFVFVYVCRQSTVSLNQLLTDLLDAKEEFRYSEIFKFT